MKPSDKTLFAIYLIEDEKGFVTIQADHYGPGFNSYFLGMQLMHQLEAMVDSCPEQVTIESLAYLPRAQ